MNLSAELYPIYDWQTTAAIWTLVNPVLPCRQVGFETDTLKFKIGDGATTWNSLSYISAPGGLFATVAQGAKADNALPSPVGALVSFPCTAAPPGWLKRDGSPLSRTTYSALWAFAKASGNIITDAVWTDGGHDGAFSYGDGDATTGTTFRIPDARGLFDRAFDNGRGLDSGRAIGTNQDSQNKDHVHPATSGNDTPDHSHTTHIGVTNIYYATGVTNIAPDTIGGPSGSYNPVSSGRNTYHTHPITVNTSTDGTSGNEVRVKNSASLACIKY
jgi:hypothetical protein